jgi:hypothetical protein
LFEATVRDLCPPRAVEAFLVRARRMREGMTKVLGLDLGSRTIRGSSEASFVARELSMEPGTVP